MGIHRAVKRSSDNRLRRHARVAGKRSTSRTTKRTGRPVRTRRPVPKRPVEAKSPFQRPPGDRHLRDDPRLDRRIIEGMLHDRDGLMDEMLGRGINGDAVLRRAAELGLSEALIRQVKGVAADLAGERPGRKSPPPSLGARTCLCCDRIFLSAGPANRLCMRCRGGDAGLAQL